MASQEKKKDVTVRSPPYERRGGIADVILWDDGVVLYSVVDDVTGREREPTLKVSPYLLVRRRGELEKKPRRKYLDEGFLMSNGTDLLAYVLSDRHSFELSSSSFRLRPRYGQWFGGDLVFFP